MKGLLLYVFFFLQVAFVAGQNLADTIKAQAYLERMVAITEDESKEDSIIIYAEKAAELFRENGLTEDYVHLLLMQGQQVYEEGYVEAAVKAFDLGIREAQNKLPDRHDLTADLYYQISRAYIVYRMYNESQAVLDSCYKYRLLHGDTLATAMADTYNLMGASARNLNQLSKSEKYYQKSLDIYASLGERYLVSRAQSNLGNVFMNQGFLNKAIDNFEQALEIREELRGLNHPTTAAVLFNLGVACQSKGAYGEAIEYFEMALSNYEENRGPEHSTTARVIYSLGSLYRETGQFTLAEDYLQRSLGIFTQLQRRLPDLEILVYRALGNLQFDLDNKEAGLDYRKKELQLTKSVSKENDLGLARTLDQIGLDFMQLGTLDSAIHYLQKAAQIYEKSAFAQIYLSDVYNDMADAYLIKDDRSQASLYAQQALSIQKNITQGKNPLLAYSYNTLAKIALLENQAENAINTAQQAIEANHNGSNYKENKFGNPEDGYLRADYLFESIFLKAGALEQLGKFNEANHQYRDADLLLDKTKNQLISRTDRLNQSKNVYRLSSAAVRNSLAIAESDKSRNPLESAFYFAEKSKASVLTQSIAANQAKYFAGLPTDLIKLEEKLKSDISYYSLQLNDEDYKDQFPAFRDLLFQARQEYRELIKNFEKDYPFYYELRHSNIIPQAKAVQFALSPDQAIISYFTTDNLLYVFLITKDHFEIKQSSIDEEFQDMLLGMYKGISLRLDDVYVDNAAELYKVLMPFELESNIQHLIFVPDGELLKIPFETLLTEETEMGGPIDFSQLPYLIKDYRISYAPSVSIFYQQKTTSSNLRDDQLNQFTAFAPVFEEREQIDPTSEIFWNSSDAVQRSVTIEGEYFAALPATRQEVLAIQKVFQDNKLPTNAFVSSSATESQMKGEKVGLSKYLHIATHGFVNESSPELSGLLLYQDTTNTEDDVLSAAEVYNLRLNADLVVLSACETGIGKLTTGEGILGLSRAFMYAGAENLMVSLWKVVDQSTAQFMADFYQFHLQNAEDAYSQALRQAKLDMIRSGNFASPYYWSAFVLIGN